MNNVGEEFQEELEQIELAKAIALTIGDRLDIHPLWTDETKKVFCMAQQLEAEWRGLA